MKDKHKAYSVFGTESCDLIPWIVRNLEDASSIYTFLDIPVRLRIEQYLATVSGVADFIFQESSCNDWKTAVSAANLLRVRVC